MTDAALRTPARDPPAEAADAPMTVLVVDDSRAQRRLLVRMLLPWGYDVVEAASGSEALTICASRQVDLVLSDWLMPGLSGLDFCRLCRALPGMGYTYFLILTSRTEATDIARALSSGADDYLRKPVDRIELRARLGAGERIVRMQRELHDKNRLLNDAMASMQAAHAALAHDLAEARRFQMSLVPEGIRKLDGGRLSMLLRPSGDVGGDLVGAFDTGPSRLMVYAMDVAGHGVASALLAARVASHLGGSHPDRNIAFATGEDGTHQLMPPEGICARLNDLMLEELQTDLYMTMLLADVDFATGRVRFVQAGHPHPFVVRRGGGIDIVGGGGHPIGLIPGARFRSLEITLEPGERLLIVSDGATESPLGELGLADWLNRSRDLPDESLLGNLVARIMATCPDGHSDDISAVLVERG